MVVEGVGEVDVTSAPIIVHGDNGLAAVVVVVDVLDDGWN